MKRRRNKRAFARGGRTRRKGMFLGGLFGGGQQSGGGGYSSTSSNNNTSTQIDPGGNYYPLQQSVLKVGQDLLNKPYEAYDPNQRIAGFTPDQETAFQNIRNNQGSWSPAFNAGQSNLYSAAGQAGGVGGAGDTAFGQALSSPTGTQASQPYLQAGTQSWTDPGVAQSYMGTYLDTAAQGITNTATRAFDKALQGINDTFTGGNAGAFGRERHGNETALAATGFAEGLTNQLGQLYNQGYNQAQSAFGADQSRQLSAGATAGSLATGDVNARANLGTAQVGAANTGVNAGINAGNALINSGSTLQTQQAKDASQLLASGSQQQTQAQKVADFNYQQWLEQQNAGYNNALKAQQLSQGWQLPTSSTSQSQSWGNTGTMTPTGSVAGNVLGAASTIAGMGTGKGSTVGGDIWNAVWGNSPTVPGTDVPGNGTVQVKRGGRIKSAFAAGGHAPVVKALRQSAQRRQPAQMQRLQAFQQKQQGPQAGPPPAFRKGGKVNAKAAVHKHERAMHKGKPLTPLAGGGKVDGAFSPMPRRGFAYAKGGRAAFADGGLNRAVEELLLNTGDSDLIADSAFLRARPTPKDTRSWGRRAFDTTVDAFADLPAAFGRAWDRGAADRGQAFRDAVWNATPMAQYNNAVEASRRLLSGEGDWIDRGVDVGELALGAFGAMPGSGSVVSGPVRRAFTR